MKQQSKLSQEQQQQTGTQQTQATAGREFASPEEMLRFDAAQTAVPPDIAERLKKSVGAEAKPRQSWWRRFFGETNP